jgi:hypothetical protein
MNDLLDPEPGLLRPSSLTVDQSLALEDNLTFLRQAEVAS